MIKDLIERLKQAQIVHKGPVELKNAGISAHYIDIKEAYGDPQLFFLICEYLREKIPSETTCIAAAGYGGIPLAAKLSGLYRRLTLVRDEPKEYGKGGWLDGHMPSSKDKIAIVDDVCTTGSSLRKIMEALRPTGAEVLGCYVVVKRGDVNLSVPISYLMTAEELL